MLVLEYLVLASFEPSFHQLKVIVKRTPVRFAKYNIKDKIQLKQGETSNLRDHMGVSR